MTSKSINQDIAQLNSFLKGEIAAVETYRCALQSVDENENSTAHRVLRDNLLSHHMRVQELSAAITELGGKPEENSGMWGTFVAAVQSGANVLGDSVAVSVLQRGEDHGIKDYEDVYGELTAPSRRFVATRLIPEQERTHAAIHHLQQTMQS